MGGDSGKSAPVVVQGDSAGLQAYNDRAGMNGNGDVASLLARYGNGTISLDDAMKDAQSEWGNGAQYQQFQEMLQTSPASAARYDQDQLMNGDATKGLFGNGGMLDKSEANYGQAMNNVGNDSSQYQSVLNDINSGKGLQLNQDDQKLYGDLSGNVARTMGGQEQALQQSLADRGLGAAPSGVANQEYSGLYGNKFEQLGQLQDQIAMNRVNQAMQVYQTQLSGLTAKGNLDLGQEGQAAGTAMGLSGQYQNALSNMYNRATTGENNEMNQLASSAGLTLQQQEAQQNALNEGFSQQQATKTPSFGDVMAGAGENFLGNLTGGAGKSAGAAGGSGMASVFA